MINKLYFIGVQTFPFALVCVRLNLWKEHMRKPCLLEHTLLVCVKKQQNKRKVRVFLPCLSHSAITSLRDLPSSSSTDLESKPSILFD